MKFLFKLEANFASMMFGRSSSSITHFVLILLKTWLPWTILVLFNSSIILMRVSTFLPQKIDIFIICVSFGLAVILMIMSISTFKTANILYIVYWQSKICLRQFGRNFYTEKYIFIPKFWHIGNHIQIYNYLISPCIKLFIFILKNNNIKI